MCGINLVLNARKNGEMAIRQMMETTRHRGPNHSAWVKVDESIFIAGNRLKILDLRDEANQPILSEDGNTALVWNGALYNYQELRNLLLEKGERFETHSDGEVLIKWLQAYGVEGIKQLRGMFAFVFVDGINKQVVLARDPTGMKPLYYFHRHGVLIGSSEAKSILRSGMVPAKMDISQYIPYFYCRHSLPEASFFKDIQQVLPGTIMCYGFDGKLLDTSRMGIDGYTDLPLTSENFKEILTDAILRQFHADVPVGLLLSGGADSSMLYHQWYKETGVPLHTFTVGFEEAYRHQYNDAQFAAKLAAKYRGDHHEIRLCPQDIMDAWPEYISTLDQPIGDSASILTWLLAREASKEVKVLISGAGADELFGGYNRHKAFRFYLKYPALHDFISRFPHSHLPVDKSKRKLLASIHPESHRTFMNFSALLPLPDALAASLQAYYPHGLPDYKAALEWDRSFYLVNDVLKIHDNACMVHGIEGRAPYLDLPMVSFSNKMTETEHLKLGDKTWIREWLREEGMRQLANRKKLGFGLPIREWIRDHKIFREMVFSGILEFAKTHRETLPEEMYKLAQNPTRHYKERFLLVWNLFVLSSWIKENGL